MALINKFVIKDFTKERYLALVRAHPRLADERLQRYIMLSLTFASLSILGMFAIFPTLSTIVELNRKLEDSSTVVQALKTKINNLTSLQSQYNALLNTWTSVDTAVPQDPRIILVLGQLQTIAKNNQVTLTGLQSFEVEVSNPGRKQTILPKEASYVFTVTAAGKKDQLLQFVTDVANFDRILALESVNYANEEKQTVTIRARTFFTP